jgi:hypothetical protein
MGMYWLLWASVLLCVCGYRLLPVDADFRRSHSQVRREQSPGAFCEGCGSLHICAGEVCLLASCARMSLAMSVYCRLGTFY